MKWLSIVLSATTVMTPGTGDIATDTEGRTPVGVVSSSPEKQEAPLDPMSSIKAIGTGNTLMAAVFKVPASKTLLERHAANQARLLSNTKKMNKAIAAVKRQVGKTWYVFSGATPSGWDCSGLVMWTYKKLGVELEHSATKQAHSGKFVNDPVPGDIAAFSYDGKKWFYHVGLYIGNGKMVHAYHPGTRTRIDSVSHFARTSGVKVRFIRIVDQLHPAA
jgi:cell wall-associated NlpC family hydrolase